MNPLTAEEPVELANDYFSARFRYSNSYGLKEIGIYAVSCVGRCSQFGRTFKSSDNELSMFEMVLSPD